MTIGCSRLQRYVPYMAAPLERAPKPQLPKTAAAKSVASWPRDEAPGLRFNIPTLWRSSVRCNPHAAVAAREVLRWLENLGCSDSELARVERFDVAGYAGIAFPLAPPDRVVLVAKFISLWLLWDDVHVESRAFRWCLDAASLEATAPPQSFSRFDRGWWTLFRELAERRSNVWVDGLCRAMSLWDEAAATEAAMFAKFGATGELPDFDVQLELRAMTIGMMPTIALLEDIHDRELPHGFHQLPAVKRLKWLSGLLVGLGNEVFSFAKDLEEGQPNLASNLMLNSKYSAAGAVARLIAMHDEGIAEFDRVAATLVATDGLSELWVRDLRFATLGFTIWESEAPRYASYKVLNGDRVIEPTLCF